ncbi:MAG TPA: polyhydroxyalkanoic acid system family protein [Thermoanaerobaculia bacterium]|nr:polyhydroxyalkanoic acid system family protein [Thermoanaerobaculia bacterium]
MSTLRIVVDGVARPMAELRPALDARIKEEFPGGMLKWSWDGDVMHLSGPGAKGTIHLEGGRLVGQAELGAPATLMRPVIEQKITRAMQRAAA